MNVQEIGSFYSLAYGGQAYWLGWFDFNWGKLWNLITDIWPVIAVATFGGLAYNMRGMRANLLDTPNAQYVEPAKAKITRAIVLEPGFILLAEPTSALDLSVQAQIIKLSRKLQRDRCLRYFNLRSNYF